MKKKLFSWMLVICILLVSVPVIAGAEDAVITWDFADGVLTISGDGAMTDYAAGKDMPWFSHRVNITKVIIKDGVTSIGTNAFYACTALTSVEIGKDVTYVGKDAFARCNKLTDVRVNCNQSQWETVTIGTGNDYFTGASFIYTAGGEFGDGFTWHFDGIDTLTIGGTNSTYTPPDTEPWKEYNSKITHVVVEKGITTLGNSSFRGCTAKTISLPDGLEVISEFAFFYSCFTDVVIPDTVTTIGTLAFAHSAIESITIPEKTTDIEYFAFINCTNLKQINISENNSKFASVDGNMYSKDLTQLYKYAPGKAQTHFEIPITVTQVNNYAFNCHQLEEITVSENVEHISFAESGASYFVPEPKAYLNKINVHEDNLYYTSVDGKLFSKDKTVFVQHAGRYETEYTVPEGTICIAERAFESSSLQKVVLPDTVQEIEDSAFRDSGLTEIDIPDGITEIESRVFQFCRALKVVEIPTTVTYIGSYAFDGCNNITDVYYGGTESQWNMIKYRDIANLDETIAIHLTEEETSGFSSVVYSNEKLSGEVNVELSADCRPVLAVYKNGQMEDVVILDKTNGDNALPFSEILDVGGYGDYTVKMLFIDIEDTLQPCGKPAKVIIQSR